MTTLDGKVVVVTGAARGQGRSHAMAVAREGASVVLLDVAADMKTVPYPLAKVDDLGETEAAIAELGVPYLIEALDVCDRPGMERLMTRAAAQFGGIDSLIINHGIQSFSFIEDMSYEMWDEVIATNLTGVFNTCRTALPHMFGRGGGRIVVTSSMFGKRGARNLGHYAASKWAVIGLVKSLALELAHRDITVNAICPACVDTPIIQNEAMYKVFRPDLEHPTKEDVIPVILRDHSEQPVPWVAPADITDTVMFLLSSGAKYITGETIAVAAGLNANNAA